MSFLPKSSIYAGLLVLGQSHMSLAEERIIGSGPQSAVDSQNGPPPCGADNICNLAVCPQDPDCPEDLPSSGGAAQPSPEVVETINCDSTQALDIRAVAWNIADDWTNFERSIEDQTGFNLGNCTRDRFWENGKVECVNEYDCKMKDGQLACKLGHGSGLGQKIKIYQTFLDKMAVLSQADRRACYAGLMTHEFAHTCEHYAEEGPEARADAAVSYWKGRFPVSSTLDPQVECGFND